MDLATLIAPLNVATFMAECWERAPRLISRPCPEWCRELLTLQEVDRVVAFTMVDSRDPGLRVVKTEGGAVQESSVRRHPSGKPEIEPLFADFREGQTLVLSGLHRRWTPVARLAAALEEHLHHPVAVNAYLTPPGGQGFAAHYDGHDVFLLHLHGQKHWSVYREAIHLPLEEQRVPLPTELGERLIEATVKPGEVLYIPRGFVHRATAGDAPSLHLTIGVHPRRWVEVLREAISHAAETDPKLREAAPADLRGLEEKLSTLLHSVADSVSAQGLFQRVLEQDVRHSRAWPDGHFGRLGLADSIELSTPLRHRAGLRCRVRVTETEAILEFGPGRVAGPKTIHGALAYIASHSSFTSGDLPDELTDNAKLVLSRRLFRDGLLTYKEPA